MLIPIGTDIRTSRTPLANYLLIAVNVVVFLFTDYFGGRAGLQLKALYGLDAVRPMLHQYLTYQFLHGDWLHLAGNMLFLWIFGNAVCDRMGSWCYTLFYLAGGVSAGYAFAHVADNPLVGASGSIAAVTTAFLVLFPRVHITMLVWMLFIFTLQVPAMILIVFKIILWDNVIAPQIGQTAAQSVAYSAHLGGYSFGFAVALGMLLIRALPRNQFDLMALWDRWRRRRGWAPLPASARRVAAGTRPVLAEELDSRPLGSVELTPIEQQRERIASALAEGDQAAAVRDYLELIKLDSEQVLSRPQQLELANLLAQARHYQAAADAYEAFLSAYPAAGDAAQVRLFLGLIYARYLQQYERAALHLRRAAGGLQLDSQRTLAEDELQQALDRLLGREGDEE